MLSVNEVGGTVLKAARGAGIPLGQAEDLARVAGYLVGIGGDPSLITQALTEPVTPAEVTWEANRVVITKGSAAMIAPVLCDAFRMGYDNITFNDIRYSAYVAAALAVEGVPLWFEGCTLRRGDSEVIPAKPGPFVVPQADWDVWLGLAAKTYVPESEASRLAGAGAGLTDND